jgi:hypothetical protein
MGVWIPGDDHVTSSQANSKGVGKETDPAGKSESHEKGGKLEHSKGR